MRTFLVLWFGPLFLLGGWYGLSVNDFHMGLSFFSRETHDEVFKVYSSITGIAPEVLPGMILKAILVDNLFVVAFLAFKKRDLWWHKFADMALTVKDSVLLWLMPRPEPVKVAPYTNGQGSLAE